ncbi:hypothetical protein [Metabacillus arenae]|uniref:hypothetical protein n=1 Tax=Metabacillus arenae TaxID=2771434 RepID=UPI001CD18CF4|nr:hypothetical protein [Metabacillus arenae]
MRQKFNRYTLPSWVRQVRSVGVQIIIPLTIFQGIRTLFFPTTFDVFLLAILILLALAFHFEVF